jgi:hypothetical protein
MGRLKCTSKINGKRQFVGKRKRCPDTKNKNKNA